MTDKQSSDVLKCSTFIPDLDVSTRVYFDDDEDSQIYAGDLVTVEMKTVMRSRKKKASRSF